MKNAQMAFMGLVLAAVSFFGKSVSAQEAPAPTWRVGTICTYQMTQEYLEGSRKNTSFEYQQTITSVDSDRVTMSVGKSAITRVVTLEGNPLAHGIGKNSPAMPLYSFPLHVGKRWSGESVYTNSRNIDKVTNSLQVVVAGYENVTVPAGTLPAFKIKVNGTYTTVKADGRSGGNKSEETLWYAPSVNRMAKSQYAIWDWSGSIWTKESHELKSCVSP